MADTLKVLHLSTHDENCGIGKYQEMFLETLREYPDMEHKFFDLSPNQLKIMSPTDLAQAMKTLKTELRGYDILHIQYEFSFFYYRQEFKLICQVAKKLRKKIVVTLHSSPYIAYTAPRLGGLGPRSMVAYARAVRLKLKFFRNFIDPLKQADRIVVHNKVTVEALAELGIDRRVMREIVIPVPAISHDLKSTEITEALNRESGDIIYATIGFLHKFKGIKEAVKALKYLPDNYKLAIVGGVHPEAGNETLYDEISDLIRNLDVIDRVYITGYVEQDELLNALIRECDICVYPYDKVYYSNVSSASLNNAFANFRPLVAYPTKSFKELNTILPAINLTQSYSYYEMAKVLQRMDLDKARELSRQFAEQNSYPKVAPTLIDYYRELIPV